MRLQIAGITIAVLGIGMMETVANAQGPEVPPPPSGWGVQSLDDLVRLDPIALESLYRQSPPAPMPAGKVLGRPVVLPGSIVAVPASRAGRLLWQGKIFDPETGIAVNRFFGVRAIRGELSYGESWLDGGPALILDYERTSRIYGPYRDELREVAPGLVLGLMYDRRTPKPKLVRFFALDVHTPTH